MKVGFIKKHKNARIPSRSHSTDTGYDVYCVEDFIVPARGKKVVDVGMDVAYIEDGYWFKIEARSGLGFKHSIYPHPGIIDSDYTGDLGILLYNLSDVDYVGRAGDKIAQIVVYKREDVEMIFADSKRESVRGDKGFGSSGR